MGIFAALFSAFFGFSKDVVSKRVAVDIDSTTSTFASFVFALPFYAAMLLWLVVSGQGLGSMGIRFWEFVVLRALTDVGAEWFKMKAFSCGELSTVTTVVALTPIFLLLTSPFLTGDPVTWSGTVALLISVAGSMLLIDIGKREGKGGERRAIWFGLASAFFFSLNICFDRLAVQEGSAVMSGFAMTLFSAIFLLVPFLAAPGRWKQLRDNAKPLGMRGLFEMLFMTAKLYALQFLSAPHVLAIQRLSLVFSIVGGRFLFGERQLGRRMAAAVLVLIGSLIVILG